MPEVNSSRLLVVYPPCDMDAIKTGGKPISRKQRQCYNQRYTFLSMNRFWPEKKLDIIVKAAGSLSSVAFPHFLSIEALAFFRLLFIRVNVINVVNQQSHLYQTLGAEIKNCQ